MVSETLEVSSLTVVQPTRISIVAAPARENFVARTALAPRVSSD